MRILLVDDEEDILEGMLAGIDFAALGFDWVHTAGSAQEAREILEKEPVDILLTDIEMPGESGLELLDWLRQQNANFDYAKKAVEMHSFDYYLKPISYDGLRAHLEAAVREVRKKHSESAYRQMGEYWLKGRRENQTGFWTSVLASVSPLAEVTRGGRDKGISYREEDQFTLCYVRVMDKEPQPLERGGRAFPPERAPLGSRDPLQGVPLDFSAPAGAGTDLGKVLPRGPGIAGTGGGTVPCVCQWVLPEGPGFVGNEAGL